MRSRMSLRFWSPCPQCLALGILLSLSLALCSSVHHRTGALSKMLIPGPTPQFQCSIGEPGACVLGKPLRWRRKKGRGLQVGAPLGGSAMQPLCQPELARALFCSLPPPSPVGVVLAGTQAKHLRLISGANGAWADPSAWALPRGRRDGPTSRGGSARSGEWVGVSHSPSV